MAAFSSSARLVKVGDNNIAASGDELDVRAGDGTLEVGSGVVIGVTGRGGLGKDNSRGWRIWLRGWWGRRDKRSKMCMLDGGGWTCAVGIAVVWCKVFGWGNLCAMVVGSLDLRG